MLSVVYRKRKEMGIVKVLSFFFAGEVGRISCAGCAWSVLIVLRFYRVLCVSSFFEVALYARSSLSDSPRRALCRRFSERAD